IQVKSDCGIPFFCSSNEGLCVGSASVVACSFDGNRSRASTSCQTQATTLRPASTLTRASVHILLVSIICATTNCCSLVPLCNRGPIQLIHLPTPSCKPVPIECDVDNSSTHWNRGPTRLC